jgi:glycerate dehydrogenase
MNIVVLDGYTLNPGDLSWQPLAVFGPCQVYDRTAPDQVMDRAAPAEILLTNKVELSRNLIENLQRLRYIGVLATGTNVVDLAAARARNIPVTNVPAYGARSVAQATLALILELVNQVGHHAQRVREGGWTRSADWCLWEGPLIELAGLTMGIVGYGRIGQAVGELATALGMTVLAHSPHHTPPLRSPASNAPPPSGSSPLAPRPSSLSVGVRFVDLKTLFCQSDIITLHCPLTAQTRELVNAERLSWVKHTAFLINTSRGQLIEESALAESLNSGRIAGAGLDVLSSEPPPADNPLLRAANCYITPHIAWATQAARSRLMAIAVENVRAFLDGRPKNVVN